MRNPLYDFPYGYDEGGLYESSVVDGRTAEQIAIDEKQSQDIEQEKERSIGVDEEQSKKIQDLKDSVDTMKYYYTEE